MTKYRIIQQLPESPLNKYPYAIQYYIEPYTDTEKAKWPWQKDKITIHEGRWKVDKGDLYKDIGVTAFSYTSGVKWWYALFNTLKEADDALNKVIIFFNNSKANSEFKPILMRETTV